MVLDFDRLDLESKLYNENNIYHKVPVVWLLTTLTFVACLVHNFLYSYSIKLVLIAFGS